MLTYHLIINGEVPRKRKYLFTYGNTKNIEIYVSKNGASILMTSSKDYRENIRNSYLTNLMKEGTKKAALAHLLLYSKQLKIGSVTLNVLKNETNIGSYDLSDDYILYPLIEGDFIREISKTLRSDTVLGNIINTQKTKQGHAVAAVYAYLYSKTKKYELERFQYLWMAFNGYYSYLFPKEKYDKNKIELLLQKYSFGQNISSKGNREKIGNMVKLLLFKEKEDITKEFLQRDDTELAAGIGRIIATAEGKQLNLSTYGYMLGDFPYYLRCSVFHGEKPILLFSFEDDMELKALRVSNKLIEEFLDEYLYECFINSI